MQMEMVEGRVVVATLSVPDDGHIHLRDGAGMEDIVPHAARQFGRAITMPNLKPPITKVTDALLYKERILDARPEGSSFVPLMTLYLTESSSPEDVRRAKEAGILGYKLYPAGATTNSDDGVTDIAKTYQVLEAMQREGLTLFVHGEVTHVGAEEAEAKFLEQKLIRLRDDFPELKISVEHVSTKEMAEWVADASRFTVGTITPHHLLYNRDVLFSHPDREHFLCKPELKREQHRQALLRAATSGTGKFFLGSDSAPHPSELKALGGCYGCYTAHAAMEMYAEAFDEVNAIDRLEPFASHYFADFHGLPRNAGTITLRREPWDPPESYRFGNASVKPLPHRLKWKLVR